MNHQIIHELACTQHAVKQPYRNTNVAHRRRSFASCVADFVTTMFTPHPVTHAHDATF
jgi:hypothetical protein